jgi:hypothetical protein
MKNGNGNGTKTNNLNLTPDSVKVSDSLINQPEQVFYNDSYPGLILNGKIEKQVYNRKEKVIIDLDLKDSNSKPINGNFSISVSEKIPGKYSNLNPDMSSVMRVITGDNSLVLNNADKRCKELSLNMEAYKKWLEKAKTGSISFPYSSEDRCFLLEGNIYEKSSRNTEAGKIIFLSTPDSFANLKYSISDSNGRFIFALDKSYDNKKLILNINSVNDPKEYFMVLENKQMIDSTNNYEDFEADNRMTEFINKSKKLAIVNKVYYKTNGLKTNSGYKNNFFHFYGSPDNSVRLSDFIELEDFKDISKNILPGVKFKKKKDRYVIAVRNIFTNSDYLTDNCLVLLNNIPFYDYEYLSTMGSNQIEHIDVVYRHIAYGNIDFTGILSVYTKDKVLISNRQSIIYENKVENSAFLNNIEKSITNDDFMKLPTFKQVLFWKPDLTFNASGNARLEFYTSDLATEYIVDIEGLTEKGFPVSKKMTFKVK